MWWASGRSKQERRDPSTSTRRQQKERDQTAAFRLSSCNQQIHTEAYHAMRRALSPFPLRALTTVETSRVVSVAYASLIYFLTRMSSAHYAARTMPPANINLNCPSATVCQTTHGRTFQNFMKNVLDIKAGLCQTHATTHCSQQWNTSKILQRRREIRKVLRDAL